MAKFSFNSDNLDSDNSLIIEGIKIDSTFTEIDPLDVLSSLINSQGDINGDGNNDLFVQSSLLLVNNALIQENFLLFGSDSLPSTINLAELDSSNGFFFSSSLVFASSFADINGDDLDELFLTTVDPLEQRTSTAIILGNNEFPETIDIENLDADEGFTVFDNENSLVALSIEGDINNDNINDLAFFSASDSEETSEVINKIVFGLEDYGTGLDISNLDGTNGFIVNDTVTLSGTGEDINRDEFDDLIFISNSNPINYIIFGQSEFEPELDLDELASDEGFIIIESGSTESDRLNSVFSGDINGDEINDIIVQKSIISENTEGESITESARVFVVYGSNDNTQTTIDLANLDGNNGFSFDSQTELQSVVDINGDSLQDLFIKDTTNNQIYVIFGGDNIAANFDFSTLDGTNGFAIENTNIESQTLVNSGIIGDINGDSIDDVSLGTEDDKIYVLLGSQEEFPTSIDLTDIDTNALEISGNRTTGGIAGFSDLNGDGADEIIFNAVISEEDNTNEEGNTLASSSIVFGDSDLSFATNNLANRPTIELFRFRNTFFDSGTYVFVGEAEKDAILADEDLRNTFSLDGVQEDGTVNPAFKASPEPGDDLIDFYRLKSLDVPGTFLFVGREEYDLIFADDSDQRDKWQPEGFDGEGNDIPEFYLLDGSADSGIPFNRFQNTQNNTFLYAGPGESEAIENDADLSSLFNNQGLAFKSLP